MPPPRNAHRSEPRREFRRPSCLSHAARAVRSFWRSYAASASAGGRFPIRLEDSSVAEPIHPVERCELHRLQASPRAAGLNHLGPVQPDDGLGQGVAIRIANAPNGLIDSGLGQALFACGWRDVGTLDPHGGPGRREGPPRGRIAPARARQAPSRCEASSTPASPRCAARRRR